MLEKQQQQEIRLDHFEEVGTRIYKGMNIARRKGLAQLRADSVAFLGTLLVRPMDTFFTQPQWDCCASRALENLKIVSLVKEASSIDCIDPTTLSEKSANTFWHKPDHHCSSIQIKQMSPRVAVKSMQDM